jgi:hypothetical protein
MLRVMPFQSHVTLGRVLLKQVLRKPDARQTMATTCTKKSPKTVISKMHLIASPPATRQPPTATGYVICDDESHPAHARSNCFLPPYPVRKQKISTIKIVVSSCFKLQSIEENIQTRNTTVLSPARSKKEANRTCRIQQKISFRDPQYYLIPPPTVRLY